MLASPSILFSLMELQSQLWQQRQGSSGWKGVCKNKTLVTGKKIKEISTKRQSSNLLDSGKKHEGSHRVPSCAELSFILFPEFSTK